MQFTTKALRLAVAVAATAVSAATASAQLVTLSTTGTFSGTGCTATTCTFGGFTLTYTNQPVSDYLAPTTVDFGQFVTQASSTTQPPTSIANDVTFTLMVMQTAPTTGNSTVVGTIRGSLAFNPSQSTLTFTPTSGTSFSIGPSNYSLITDNTGRIAIAPPIVGQNPNTTIVKANVAVVPEPSTYALMGTGLAGLLGMASRRRRAVA